MNPDLDGVTAAATALLEAQMLQDFASVTFQAPQPLTADQLAALMVEIEDGKQQLFCHPDDLERTSTAVYGAGLGLHVRVEPSSLLDPGQVILAPSRRDVSACLFPAVL